MSRQAPVLIASTPSARPSGQMSHGNRFQPSGGRGRGLRAVRRVQGACGPVDVSAARVAWSRFVARICGSREECAVVFGVTFQTACNWFDAFSTPTGDKVMQAARDWPDQFAAMLGEVA